MHRRPLGRGRWIVVISAVMLVVACLLRWWEEPPGPLPPSSGIGLSDARGLIVFLVAIAAILLITLPYATDGPVVIDRTISFLILWLIGSVAWAWWGVYTFLSTDVFPVPPTRGLGFWLAGIGLILFARGVFEIYDAHQVR